MDTTVLKLSTEDTEDERLLTELVEVLSLELSEMDADTLRAASAAAAI